MSNDLDSVITDLRAHRERLVRDLSRVDAALQALSGGTGESQSTATPLIDRVQEVFDEEPTRMFSVDDVLRELAEQGWVSDAADPENAMRTTLSRMVKRGHIVRVDRGQYSKKMLVKVVDPWATPAKPEASPEYPWDNPPSPGGDPWARKSEGGEDPPPF
jgi:hypothetical protein